MTSELTYPSHLPGYHAPRDRINGSLSHRLIQTRPCHHADALASDDAYPALPDDIFILRETC